MRLDLLCGGFTMSKAEAEDEITEKVEVLITYLKQKKWVWKRAVHFAQPVSSGYAGVYSYWCTPLSKVNCTAPMMWQEGLCSSWGRSAPRQDGQMQCKWTLLWLVLANVYLLRVTRELMERTRKEGKKLVVAQPSGEFWGGSLYTGYEICSLLILENVVGNMIRRGKTSIP